MLALPGSVKHTGEICGKEREKNMEYKNIALIGAGAVGSYIIWGMSQRKDINFFLVAEGERKERLQREGIQINGIRYSPKVLASEEAKSPDLVIVATKYNGLQGAADMLEEICTEDTAVMSLMNGVDSEEVIAERIGADAVLPALIKISSERKGGSVCFHPERTIGIILGETEEGKCRWGSARTDAFQRLFSQTGIHFRVTDVILSEIWAKFRLNITKNLPQAVLGCGLGAYDDSEHVRFIMEKLGQEVDCIAAAKGIDISLAEPSSSAAGKPLKTARFSTLQDLDAKRHTEIDMFSGTVVSMGQALSVPTPYNEMMLHLIKALEEKNDGKFEY